MRAGNYPIVAEQGSLFTRVIRYENPDETAVNLTDYTARMQVRKKEHSPTPMLELTTTENGGISIEGETGTITITIPATTMADAPSGSGWYDLELIPPSGEDDAFRLIEGTFAVKREITKEAT